MCKVYYVSGLVSIVAVLGCSESSTCNTEIYADSVLAFQDTLRKWELYMESSSDGLWEDSVQYNLEIERVHSFGGEYDPNPQFYKPAFIRVFSDTLLISDIATQSLICMDTTGTVLWKFGESGEGPGYFAGIGQVDMCGGTIAVVNNGLSAVELLNREGTLVRRLSIERPQDVAFIDNNRLLVFSKSRPGGDVHLFDIEADSILFSFGDGEWDEWPYSSSVYEIYSVFIEPDRVAYLSHFEKRMVFANITDGTSYWTDIRDLPFEITPHSFSYDKESGMRFDVAYPLYRSMFPGPFGEVDIIFTNLMYNGRMYSPDNHDNYPPVTVIDRFSTRGEYLDSYCLPDSSVSIVDYNGNGYMVGIQAHTGTVFGYRVNGGVECRDVI